jgi:hypothetical protein
MRKTDRKAVVIRGRASEGCLVASRLKMQSLRMTGEEENASAKGGCSRILPGYRVPGSLRTPSHNRREANGRAREEARYLEMEDEGGLGCCKGLLLGTQARLHPGAVSRCVRPVPIRSDLQVTRAS